MHLLHRMTEKPVYAVRTNYIPRTFDLTINNCTAIECSDDRSGQYLVPSVNLGIDFRNLMSSLAKFSVLAGIYITLDIKYTYKFYLYLHIFGTSTFYTYEVLLALTIILLVN